MKTFLGLLVALLSLSGCATYTQHQTPSGKVQVTIANATVKQVEDRIISIMLSKKYIVRIQTENMLRFEKHGWQRPIGPAPDERATYFISRTRRGVNVICDLEMVISPDSSYERVFSVNNEKGSEEFQKNLNDIKAALETPGA